MIDSVSCLLLTGAQAFSSLPSDALPRLPFTCEGHTTSYEGETVTGYTSSYETENGVTTCCDQARANGAICGFEVYGSTCVQYLGTRCTLAPAPRRLSDTDSPDSASIKKTVRQSSTGKHIPRRRAHHREPARQHRACHQMVQQAVIVRHAQMATNGGLATRTLPFARAL